MPSVGDRLTKAEQDIQELKESEVGAGLRAQAFGLSLVLSAVEETRVMQAATSEDVAGVKADVAEVKQTLAGMAKALNQLLNRP